MKRIFFAMLAGNLLGFCVNWASARFVIPWLWSGVTDGTGLLARAGLMVLSAIVLSAASVLWGALGAWLARRDELWVGLACGLWGFVLIDTVPAAFPIAAGVWYTPTVLVILSSALGGYMLDLRAQARPPMNN